MGAFISSGRTGRQSRRSSLSTYCLGKVFLEERRGPLVREIGRLRRAAVAHFGCEAVILARIIVDRHPRMIVEPGVHPLLRGLVDEAVLARDMQHHRARNRML